MEKPRILKVRGLPIGTNALVFRDGYPSTSSAMRIEKEQPFSGRYDTMSAFARISSQFVLIFYPTSHDIRACYPLATSCIAEDYLEKLATFLAR